MNFIRRMQVAHLCQMLLHGLMRAESRREITPSCATAGKPHDSVQMCTDSLLRTACMGNWDDWLDRFPFLTGKFITADFHADCLFLPLGYHLFMSFSCTFGYFFTFQIHPKIPAETVRSAGSMWASTPTTMRAGISVFAVRFLKKHCFQRADRVVGPYNNPSHSL